MRCYKQLSKHRLSALVVSTVAAGYIAGKDGEPDGTFFTAFLTLRVLSV
jgi:heme O synthase-like polyprenyltransferase